MIYAYDAPVYLGALFGATWSPKNVGLAGPCSHRTDWVVCSTGSLTSGF